MESKATFFQNCLNQFSCDEQVFMLYDFCFVESILRKPEVGAFLTDLQEKYAPLIERLNEGCYEDLLNGTRLDFNVELLILSVLSDIGKGCHAMTEEITLPEEILCIVKGYIEKYKLVNVVKQKNKTNNNSLLSNSVQLSAEGVFILEKWQRKVKLIEFALDNTNKAIPGKSIDSSEINDSISSLVDACDKLAKNSTYNPKTDEGRINDYIRDVYNSDKYSITSGDRQGLSATGIEPGTIDLSIKASGKQIILFECLRLFYVHRQYLSDHIIKAIGNYNPLGVPVVLLIYYCGVDYQSFFSRLCDHLQKYNWPAGVEVISELQIENTNSAVRKAKVTISKEGYVLDVHFITVKLLNSNHR